MTHLTHNTQNLRTLKPTKTQNRRRTGGCSQDLLKAKETLAKSFSTRHFTSDGTCGIIFVRMRLPEVDVGHNGWRHLVNEVPTQRATFLAIKNAITMTRSIRYAGPHSTTNGSKSHAPQIAKCQTNLKSHGWFVRFTTCDCPELCKVIRCVNLECLRAQGASTTQNGSQNAQVSRSGIS